MDFDIKGLRVRVTAGANGTGGQAVSVCGDTQRPG